MRFLEQTAPLAAPGSKESLILPRVLALGLPRCATSSLQAALERLGYGPCLHMAHVWPYPARERLCIAALRSDSPRERQELLRQLVAGFASTSDYPGMLFPGDMMDLCPDAPIILNLRSSSRAWIRSMADGIAFFCGAFFALVGFPITTDRLMYRMAQETEAMFRRRWGEGGVNGWVDERLYEMHNELVREEARKRGRAVLEFEAQDGWEPLCRFLGKDVPVGEDFPHINDQKTMTTLKRFVVVRGVACWAAIFGGLYVGWRFMPSAVPIPVELEKMKFW